MTTAILVLARTLHIGSAMLLVALPCFLLGVVRPVLAVEEIGRYAPFERRVRQALWILLGVEAFTGAAWFWIVAAQMSDASPWLFPTASDLSGVLWGTKFGRLWLERLTLGMALAGALYFASRRESTLSSQSRMDAVVLVISSLLLASLAWAGHAAAGIRHQPLHLIADVVHLLVGSIWPMGLFPLAALLLYFKQQTSFIPGASEIAMLQRFSRASLAAVVLLLATGFINGWLTLGSWQSLATTTYGRLLLAKLLAVAAMIALGACNRIYFLPHPLRPGVHYPYLRRTVAAESILTLVVLFIVGIMGMTSPA
jgi:putative copper resistance protein D